MSPDKLFSMLVTLMVMAVNFIDPHPSYAASKKAAPKYVLIPVHYLTDRNRNGDYYGPDRRYTLNCQHHMYYGTAYIPVKNTEGWMPDATFEKLGWQSANKIKSKISRKDLIAAATPVEEKTLFLQSLLQDMQKFGRNHLCLFLHGAADPFEDAAEDAAQLAYYMHCPMVIYAWPSLGKLRRYRVDEGNIEWSQKHFNTFCQDLQTLASNHPFTATLVAHSMGNRLLARGVPALQNTGMITDVAMVSPDIDAETFKHYVMGYHNNGVKVRLYVSNKDKVLPFTQMLYGGYYRLGEGVGSVLSMVSTPQQLFNFSDPSSEIKTAGEVEQEHPDSLPDEALQLENIDFTAIDPGIVGHHFPYKLVSNMSRTNQPGANLRLEKSEEGKGNLFSRFSRWWYELGSGDGPNTSTSTCLRVVRTPEKKSKK